jgi:paraquat-inducible protein A
MLDVFVVGLIVLAVKGLPGGAKISLGWGVFAFAASVIVSIVTGMLIQRLERRTAPEGRERSARSTAAGHDVSVST